jgi:hypothetical protein
MSGTKSAAQGTILAAAALTAVAGLILPASVASPAGYLELRRPSVTLQQCERAGGTVEARSGDKAICAGGIDNGAPVLLR